MSRGNQLKRQWQLLQILQSYKYGVVIDDLVSKVEYCRRTVERDLNILQEVGFPISYEFKDSSKKYWKLEQRFLESDKFLLEPTELLGLYFARQTLAICHCGPFSEGFEKLFSKLESLLPQKALSYFADLDEQFFIKNTGTSKADSARNYLFIQQINEAISGSKILKINYQKEGQTFEMLIHPYGLTFLNDSVYVLGFAEYAKEVRTLKLQRIKTIEQTNNTFRRPDDFSLPKILGGSFGIIHDENLPTTFRCELKSWAAQMIREHKFHKTQTIESDDGQKLIVSFLLNSTTEFKQWILGLGPLAKVIEPDFLKKDIASLLKHTLQLYK